MLDGYGFLLCRVLSKKELLYEIYCLDIDRLSSLFLAGKLGVIYPRIRKSSISYPELQGEERSVVLAKEFSTAAMILRLRQSRLVTQHGHSCKRTAYGEREIERRTKRKRERERKRKRKRRRRRRRRKEIDEMIEETGEKKSRTTNVASRMN